MIFTYVWAFDLPEHEQAVHQFAQPLRLGSDGQFDDALSQLMRPLAADA